MDEERSFVEYEYFAACAALIKRIGGFAANGNVGISCLLANEISDRRTANSRASDSRILRAS